MSGLNVGRDMMGTMSNTLILAFAGTALNMILLVYAYSMSYYQLLNMNIIGIEIIQGLSASLAVILTVPVIAFVASRLIPSMATIKMVKKTTKAGVKYYCFKTGLIPGN